GWRRSSYTSITAGAHAGERDGNGRAELVGSEPEDPGTNDEPVTSQGTVIVAGLGPIPGPRVEAEQQQERRLRSTSSLLSALPAGRDFGTFVHRVLERVDFSTAGLRSQLSDLVGAERARYPGDADADTSLLVSGLEAAISTPLGDLVGGACLRDVGRADRLDELSFELPVAGGDYPAGEFVIGDVAALFDRHLGADDALAGYGSELRAPDLADDLRGYMTGSLDLVFRRRGRSGDPQYFVVDYKTNRLSAATEEVSAWHYRPSALAAEMRRSHYPLQAVLYLVALHRYLRWRLPGYDPNVHLGGVLYLFLRGMACPGAPPVDGQPCGVFSWRPAPALVTELSDLLAGLPGPSGEGPAPDVV
ncbi:MAG TPA: PD-(D/E)XK nuclease family protein, partial [Acidimicrobiales bacterium]|nr:PD-(D/E)XK nuclease family protein [Acidimicrobiales bacterium]